MKKKIIVTILLIVLLLTGCNTKKEEPKPEPKPKPVIEPQKEIVKYDLDSYKFPKVKEEKLSEDYKVLVIEIDPVLTKGTIEGRKCSGKKASVCLGQNNAQAVQELVDDINTSSHNNLNVKIVKTESINEFATYKNQVTLLNGKKAYKYDEDTWLDIMKDGWYTGISDSRVQEIGEWFGTYDYDYIIDKLNLIERRNNNEFDEVWLVNVDPTLSYESIMVGTNAFWINGLPISAECAPFKIMNVSISRPDVNFECFGHATEQLLNNVFLTTNYSEYNALDWSKNSTNITTKNYQELSLFQKFMLTEDQNKAKNTGLTGVGNIHYSPNSTKDYDWNNKNKNILSKYKEWTNYPNLTNKPTKDKFNTDVYMKEKLKGTNSDARKHHRWWFSLLPHHSGFDENGYYNNWWQYFKSNKYVRTIRPEKDELNLKVDEKLPNLKFQIIYSDESKETKTLDQYEINLHIDNKDMFYLDEEGHIYARTKGTTSLKYYRDGVYGEVIINVE